MSTITYKPVTDGIAVYLDRRRTGTIVKAPAFGCGTPSDSTGWYYKPTSGDVCGEVHRSVEAVKRSLSV
jgi:hypothetical protein